MDFVKGNFLQYDKKRENHFLPREKEKEAVKLLRQWRTDYKGVNIRKPLAGATRAKIVRDLLALNIITQRPYGKVVTPSLKNRAKWKKYAQQAGPYRKFVIERKSESAEVRMKRGKIVEYGAAGTYLKLYFNKEALLDDETGEQEGVDNEVNRLWALASKKRRKPTGAKILVGGGAIMGGNLLPDAEAVADKIKEIFMSGASGQAVKDFIAGLEFLYGNPELHASMVTAKYKRAKRKPRGARMAGRRGK